MVVDSIHTWLPRPDLLGPFLFVSGNTHSQGLPSLGKQSEHPRPPCQEEAQAMQRHEAECWEAWAPPADQAPAPPNCTYETAQGLGDTQSVEPRGGGGQCSTKLQVTGNWRKEGLCYVVAESLSPVLTWKTGTVFWYNRISEVSSGSFLPPVIKCKRREMN